MLRLLAMAVLMSGALASPAAADLESGMEDFVSGLESETQECDFLRSMCRAAQLSMERAETTPPSADFLATRQEMMADTRVREAIVASEAIERKRKRRLPCFTDDVCVGVLPRARPPATR